MQTPRHEQVCGLWVEVGQPSTMQSHLLIECVLLDEILTSRAKRRREESRRGTHECVRHFKLAPMRPGGLSHSLSEQYWS